MNLVMLVVGIGHQGYRVLETLIQKVLEVSSAKRVGAVSWLLVDTDPAALKRGEELVERYGLRVDGFPQVDDVLTRLATESNARRLAFVEAPTHLHYQITQRCSDRVDVLVCEKPACVTPEESAGWSKLEDEMSREGRLLRSMLTEVPSPAVRAAAGYLKQNPEWLVVDGWYPRGSNVVESWKLGREGVVAHAFEDKSVHDVSAHIVLTSPARMEVQPDVCVHAWHVWREKPEDPGERYAASVTANVVFSKDGNSVPVRLESSLVGIPKTWVDEAEALGLGRKFMSESTSAIKGCDFRSVDVRLGVLNLVSRRTGRTEHLAINFLAKGNVKPWACVSERGQWRELPLPDGETGLRCIVSRAVELAVDNSCRCDGVFLHRQGEEMVNQFVIDTGAAIRRRYGR
jgi:predicted dehydrogenase